jgi:hypothetical protein
MAHKSSDTKHKATGETPAHAGHDRDGGREPEPAATDRADTLRRRSTARPRRADKATAARKGAAATAHQSENGIGHDGDGAAGALEAPGYGALGWMVYRTTYAVSYGVLFPVMLVAHAVPRDNPIVQGLCDGAGAARDAAGSIWSTSAVPALDSAEAAPALQYA